MRRQTWVILSTAVVIVAILIGWYLLSERNVSQLIQQGKRTNILLLGLDKVGGSSRSDTMMLISLDPEEHASLLSLPRDLRVKFEDGDFHKLNAAYPNGGAKLTRKTVSELLGVGIPFYITLDYAGFKRLIDELGGVTINVEERMQYDDNRADPPLHIDIQPGIQTFDGETALDYMRFRSDPAGDIGRIARQQKLIRALLDKGLQKRDLDTIRSMIQAIYPYLQTNLSLIDLYDLANLLRGLNVGQIEMAIVPGIPTVIEEVSYLQPQVVEMERLVARLIKGKDILTTDEISVAVFNGNGMQLIASDTADYLRARGFKIVKVANAERFDYEKSYVIVLQGENKAGMLTAALPFAATPVSPDEFEPHYSALKALIPAGTDLAFVAGAGFEIKHG
jgi:LCP family protein required for cell wall assembly